MRGKQGISVFMLSPDGLMSPFQRAQMFSLQDANIHNIAIKGMFDDCQDIVKAVQNDHAFKAKYQIGTVNSINWARVVAQVVYYFKGYFNATSSNDEQVSFCVPSGNFGNVCAGHIARQMGLPVQRLIVATNENDVLDEFFRTGAYRPRGTANTYVTSSPSMDISKASNFERFVFDLVGRDGAAVKALWADVDAGKGFDLSAKLGDAAQKFGFVSGKSSHADRLATIRALDASDGVVVDTHTADGIKVARELRLPGETIVCLETALPAKFADTIREALDRDPPRPAGFDGLEDLPQKVVVFEADAAKVKAFVEHTGRLIAPVIV
jgi:threonine synthase